MNDHLQKAIQLIEDGNHEAGLKKLEALSEHGDDEVIRSICELYYELGLIDRALPLLEELMFQYPDHGELFVFAAECYGELGKEDEAIDMLTEISQNDPSYIQAQMLLADIYQNIGLEEVAEQKLLQAEKHSPDEPIIHFGLGEFYLSRGDYQLSIPYFKKVIHQQRLPDDHPLNPELRLAEAYSATGQFEDALKYYKKGLEKNQDVDALFGYAYTALQLAEYETSIHQFTRLMELDPNYTTLYSFLAKALQENGQLDKSIEVLAAGLSKDEYNDNLYIEMAKAQFQKRHGEEGRKYLEKGIAINPSNTSAVKELLVYFHQGEQYDESLELLTFLEEYGEVDPVFERFKGKALYETDKLQDAVIAYKEALNDLGHDDTLLEEAALAFLEYGDKKEGIRLLENLLSIQPHRFDIEEMLIELKEGS